MTSLESIILDFLDVMREDLKRRAYDESGDQKQETLGRLEALRELSTRLRMSAQLRRIKNEK